MIPNKETSLPHLLINKNQKSLYTFDILCLISRKVLAWCEFGQLNRHQHVIHKKAEMDI